MWNFPPSKHREVGANALAGAAQNQLCGKALPSLITGEWYGAEDHVRAADHLNPTADLVNAALPCRAKRALCRCVSAPSTILEIRKNALSVFPKVSAALEAVRARRLATLPGKSPVSEIHFPLIHLLTTSRDYPDTTVVKELRAGMPIAGPIAQTPGLTQRKRNAQMSYQEWKETTPERNLAIYDRVRKSKGSDLSQK